VVRYVGPADAAVTLVTAHGRPLPAGTV
jgi:hypothetical protein